MQPAHDVVLTDVTVMDETSAISKSLPGTL
jgi:hypothetical protein